jgi:hypothetical protein
MAASVPARAAPGKMLLRPRNDTAETFDAV